MKLLAPLLLLGVLLVVETRLAVSGEPRPSEEEIGSVQVYLTPDQAIHELFAEAARIDTLCGVLTSQEKASIRKVLGQDVPSDTLMVLKPR
ncbi:MAG TPA: hypothetical protein VFP10_01900, partial [Candidatus Eisenbacteria bacterium]|nr:hypothetical protein [Candidatus Eisenbacteria bacterium]